MDKEAKLEKGVSGYIGLQGVGYWPVLFNGIACNKYLVCNISSYLRLYFVTWIFRRMGRISWTGRKTHLDVCNMLKDKLTLLTMSTKLYHYVI